VPLEGDSPTDGGSPSTGSNVLNASFPRLKIRMISQDPLTVARTSQPPHGFEVLHHLLG